MDPIIIIGTGLAGYNLAKEIRKLDKEQPLLLISQDDGRSYSKPMLSTGFTKNKTADDLSMGDAAKMADQLNAEIIIDTIVKSIDTARKVVVTDKAEYAYKDLVLGVGADVISPPLEGDGTDDVFSINDLQDYAKFRQSLETGEKKSVLIIGAGLIGCEFANDLANGGYDSQVVDPVGRCLPALLPESASAAVQRGLEGLGVKFHWGPLVKAVNKTETGLNIRSSFAEINLNNNINKIESSLSSATLFIDDLNATIAIDKEELGLKGFSSQKVTLDQIPDLAKMKSFIVWFN